MCLELHSQSSWAPAGFYINSSLGNKNGRISPDWWSFGMPNVTHPFLFHLEVGSSDYYSGRPYGVTLVTPRGEPFTFHYSGSDYDPGFSGGEYEITFWNSEMGLIIVETSSGEQLVFEGAGEPWGESGSGAPGPLTSFNYHVRLRLSQIIYADSRSAVLSYTNDSYNGQIDRITFDDGSWFDFDYGTVSIPAWSEVEVLDESPVDYFLEGVDRSSPLPKLLESITSSSGEELEFSYDIDFNYQTTIIPVPIPGEPDIVFTEAEYYYCRLASVTRSGAGVVSFDWVDSSSDPFFEVGS